MRIVKPDAVIVSLLFINPKDKTLYWHDSDTIEITDILWRPDEWPEFVEYFNNRPEGMRADELWEFGATSMLNALLSLKGDTK